MANPFLTLDTTALGFAQIWFDTKEQTLANIFSISMEKG